jgi:hypothetical protein
MVRELGKRVIEFRIDRGKPAPSLRYESVVFWFAAVEPFSTEITTDVVIVVLFAHDDFVDGERRGYLMLDVVDKTFRSRVRTWIETGDSAGVVESIKKLLPEGENGAAVAVCVVQVNEFDELGNGSAEG